MLDMDYPRRSCPVTRGYEQTVPELRDHLVINLSFTFAFLTYRVFAVAGVEGACSSAHSPNSPEDMRQHRHIRGRYSHVGSAVHRMNSPGRTVGIPGEGHNPPAVVATAAAVAHTLAGSHNHYIGRIRNRHRLLYYHNNYCSCRIRSSGIRDRNSRPAPAPDPASRQLGEDVDRHTASEEAVAAAWVAEGMPLSRCMTCELLFCLPFGLKGQSRFSRSVELMNPVTKRSTRKSSGLPFWLRTMQ